MCVCFRVANLSIHINLQICTAKLHTAVLEFSLHELIQNTTTSDTNMLRSTKLSFGYKKYETKHSVETINSVIALEARNCAL